MSEPRKIWGRALRRAALLFAVVFGSIMGAALLWHPDTPLPDHWNPLTPLDVAAPLTPLTGWKLRAATADDALCRRVISDVSDAFAMPELGTDNPNCQVPAPVRISRVGDAELNALETACSSALRLAMWERHGLQPAAREHFQSRVTRLLDQGSFNCRRIRTSNGPSARWSFHATAEAIDIRGLRLADGRTLTLLADWDAEGPAGAFLRDIRDAACDWFETTLGPDYNRLHADHFHLQARGWGTCR